MLWCLGFSLWWHLLLWSTGSRCMGFISCGMRAQAAPWHVGSSRCRAQTCVPFIGRRILNHCATREAPKIYLFLAVLGLCCCASAFSRCSERGLLFVVVCGLLIAVASRCGAQALGARALVVVARRLSSCGSWALERRLSSCGARA